MTEGTTYPNMATFKLALSQHAIKNEFEYRTVKSAPKRFTGICSRKNEDKCSWRIHASTTKDKKTISLFACWFQPAQISQPTVFSSHNKLALASPN